MTKGPEIATANGWDDVCECPSATTPIHVQFATSETVWRRVNGSPVPEPPDRDYSPDAFVVLKDREAGDDTSN